MTRIKNIFLILFSILILELTSQIIILTFEKKYSILFKSFSNTISKKIIKNYEINWDYKKNKMKPGIYENDFISYSINSKGFRGNEFKDKKEKIRIISFGGSTTIGLESPDDKTYPFQLEKLLNEKSDKYEVINMGFSSKSLNFIKNLFFTEAYKYEPDYITIYSNRNSLMYDGGSIDPYFEGTRLVKLNYFLQENISTYRLLFIVYKKFLNFSVDSKKLKSPFNKNGISKDYLINGYKNSIKEIVDYSKKNKIKVVLIKQAYYFEPNIFEELKIYTVNNLIELYEKNFFVSKYKIDEETQYYVVLGTILNKSLDEFNKFDNVIIVDPLKNLLKSKDNFTDYLHLTPNGNLILAQEIYKNLK